MSSAPLVPDRGAPRSRRVEIAHLETRRTGWTGHLATPLGFLEFETGREAVHQLKFLEPGDEPVAASAIRGPVPTLVRRLGRELEEYFRGTRQHFSIPIRPEGTSFQLRVWRTLQRIPWGTSLTYAELARRNDQPAAVRASARAAARNPIHILIPCHRVITSRGAAGGYAGGTWRKIHLLTIEGAPGGVAPGRTGPRPALAGSGVTA
ncbi:MAG: methylated-DNA--[protein]-cysteine S-methyltransferase [Verrucomicrobiae bacterium]|nr:methylated-DNA--[protein]-cysteine S-methyltransferase [Verrucomicrobiae bacterium]